MEDTKATTIRVQVGDYDCTYHLYQTKAHESYDGFGTMTLYVDGEERWVLISSEYVEWQTTRYASGMRSGRPSDDLHVTDLRRMLLARLFGASRQLLTTTQLELTTTQLERISKLYEDLKITCVNLQNTHATEVRDLCEKLREAKHFAQAALDVLVRTPDKVR